MKFQIAEMEIIESDFYRNLDTASLSKLSNEKCPHTHVMKCIDLARVRLADSICSGDSVIFDDFDFYSLVKFEMEKK